MKTETDIFISQIIERIVTGVSDRIPQNSATPCCNGNKDADTKFLSPTEFSRKYGISKPVCYRLINEGTLPSYQIKGSTKKYLKEEDIKRILVQVPISPKDETYEEFETRIRKGVKLGGKLWKEFNATSNKKTLSQFSLWMYSNNHTQAINNFLIINLNN